MDVRFPIGELELPNEVKMDDVNDWLVEINEYVSQLREVVQDLSDEDLKKKYREGSWTVRQLVHHITDSQITLYERLKLTLTDDNPSVPPFDQERWVELDDYELPIDISIQMLEGINQRVVAIGKGLTEKELSRVYTLQGEGESSIAETVAKLSWHERHHLAHIKIALSN